MVSPGKRTDHETNPQLVTFDDVFAAELRDIRCRRNHEAGLNRSETPLPAETPCEGAGARTRGDDGKQAFIEAFGPLPAEGEKVGTGPELNAIGLSLSGGGIRSASFCLGVLQALDKLNILKFVDYLSTVSGGGYIGSSLSAALSKNSGQFPFESKLDQDEPDAVKHIRNYSNYLMPHGKTDLLESAVIYLRGIVANIILVLPWLLFAAYLIVRSNPTTRHLEEADFLRWKIANVFPFNHFVIAAYLAFLLLVLFAIWSLIRSARRQAAKAEVPSALTTAYGISLAVLGVVAFFELQPFVLKHVWSSQVVYDLTTGMQKASVALAPIAGAVAFFWNQLQAFIKRAMESPGASSRLAAYAGKTLTYVAAAVLPLALWALVFQLSWWGIGDCKTVTCRFPEDWSTTPGWISSLAGLLFAEQGMLYPKRIAPIATLYFLCFAVLLVVSLMLRPNSNSMHRLYRDRLSKAFIFNPRAVPAKPRLLRKLRDRVDAAVFKARPVPELANELESLDDLKLSRLDPRFAPCHLINTALNIQGSKHVNRRGRNADFFMFSHRHVGSEATGYVDTRAMERVAPELDLPTAMAISAAAASSNMGAQSIRPLTPTLALLNVRVGFWVRNPRFVGAGKWGRRLREFFSLYFLYELIANLRETSWNVYVTDGGHLENLGAYELLKRRCRVIIVVDAEADPRMTFELLITLQRFARIDLGVRITLPWQDIRDTTLRVSREFKEQGKAQRSAGPHCAVGEIEYPHGGKGVIVYVKASISGDENDYITNYKARYPLFPHESTSDQFFSEEQFEVYRSLGFHCAHNLFQAGTSAVLDSTQYPQVDTDFKALQNLKLKVA